MSDRGSQWKSTDPSRMVVGGWDAEIPSGQSPASPMDSTTPPLVPLWCVEVLSLCVYAAAPVTGLGVFFLYVNGESTGILVAIEDGATSACVYDGLPITVPADSTIEVYSQTTDAWTAVRVRAVIEWQRCFTRIIGGPVACFDEEEDIDLFDLYISA